MTTEDRLRDALQREGDAVQPGDGWAAIQARIDERKPTMNRNRILAVAAAAALVAVGAVAVLAQPDDDTQPVITEPDASTTSTPTTQRPAVTTTTPTTVVEAVEMGPGVGILWSQSAATPAAIANKFARDFLNMPTPSIGAFQQGDARSGEFAVRPKPNAGPTTTVAVRQFDGQWYVVSANATNLELDTPATDARIASPVQIKGRSIAFEGHVNVGVLRYDTTLQCVVPTDVCGSDPGVYANTYFTGRGDEKAPFDETISYTGRPTGYGYVVLWTNSAEDGSVSEATVRLVRF